MYCTIVRKDSKIFVETESKKDKNRVFFFLYLIIVLISSQSVSHHGALLYKYYFLRWISIPLIFLLFIYGFMKGIFTRKFKIVFINKYLVTLFFLVLLSSIINNSFRLSQVLGWLILYTRYVLFMNFLVNNKGFKNSSFSFSPFFVLSVILTIEVFIRFFIFGKYGDEISFILGPYGTLPLGFICLLGVSYSISKYAIYRDKRYLFLSIFLIAPSIWGEIKALALGGPLVIFLILYCNELFRSKDMIIKSLRYIVYGLFALFLIYVITYIYPMVLPEKWSRSLIELWDRISYWIKYGDEDIAYVGINRISSMVLVVKQLISNNSILFGMGPGSTFAGAFFGKSGVLIERYNIVWNQFGVMVSDIGIVGLIVYYMMLLSYSKIIFRYYKHFNKYDGEFKVILLTSLGVCFYYLVWGPLYDLVWRQDAASYIFYGLVAKLYVMSRSKR